MVVPSFDPAGQLLDRSAGLPRAGLVSRLRAGRQLAENPDNSLTLSGC